jgi:hypothetical protein
LPSLLPHSHRSLLPSLLHPPAILLSLGGASIRSHYQAEDVSSSHRQSRIQHRGGSLRGSCGVHTEGTYNTVQCSAPSTCDCLILFLPFSHFVPQYELSSVSSLTSLPLLLHLPVFYPSPVPSLLSFVPPSPLNFALSSTTTLSSHLIPPLSFLPSPLLQTLSSLPSPLFPLCL